MIEPNTSPALIMSKMLALTSAHMTRTLPPLSLLACAAPIAELASGMKTAPRFGLAWIRLIRPW
ncbi:hypothetical protein D3C80_1712990 [compost metagenome]